MASITRKKTETVATVSAALRNITITVHRSLTIDESKQLRKLLKAEETSAEKQSGHLASGGITISGDHYRL